jgi:rhodanese-related sulfurtransferase
MIKLYRIITAIILFAATTITFAGSEEGPSSVVGAETIDVETAVKLFEDETIFIDVRKDKDWEAGRIPGAYHIESKKKLTEESLSEVVKKDETVVFYCNGINCLRSSAACGKAVAWGYTNVKYFRTGFPSWKGAGNPVE